MRRICVFTSGIMGIGPDEGLDAVIEDARIADEAGVEAFLVPEIWGRDAFTILAVLARETRRIQVGTGIVNVFSRSPGALAQHFATLDWLSGGRAIAGIGASSRYVAEGFHGVPFERPLARMREYVEVLRSLTAGEPLHHRGQLFDLDAGFRLAFQPVRDHIPVYIAAITPRSLRQAAEIADGVMFAVTPRDRWRGQVDSVLDHVRAAGRDPATFTVMTPTAGTDGGVRVTSDPEAGYRALAGIAAYYIARMGDFYGEHLTRLGWGEVVEHVHAEWDAGGSACGIAAMPKELVNQLGVAGDVEQCIDWLDAQQEAGFTLLSVVVDERDPDPAKRADIYRRLVG